jgi:16S rRNA pseudouridine516 synthase
MKYPSMRLDRLLANMGYGSRREIELLALAQRIQLDGQPLKDASMRLSLSPDLVQRMQVNNESLDPLPGLLLLLYKPVGTTCSHKEAGKLVYNLLPERWKKRDPQISTVGRLDKETSGLLLLTDDGALLHKITSPKQHVAKRYFVTLDRPLNGDEAGIFASGTLMLESETKPLLPAEMEVLSPTTARLNLHEGRYHQVRRMFAAVGNHVLGLHRETVGGLSIPEGMEPGDIRVLNDSDIAQIFAR